MNNNNYVEIYCKNISNSQVIVKSIIDTDGNNWKNSSMNGWNNPFIQVVPKTTLLLWWYLSNKSIYQKIFQEEMLVRTHTTSLLQIFSKVLLYFNVITEILIEADDKSTWFSYKLLNIMVWSYLSNMLLG